MSSKNPSNAKQVCLKKSIPDNFIIPDLGERFHEIDINDSLNSRQKIEQKELDLELAQKIFGYFDSTSSSMVFAIFITK